MVVGETPAVVGPGVIGSQVDDHGEILDGQFILSELMVSAAPVVVSRSVCGLLLDGNAEDFYGPPVVPRAVEQETLLDGISTACL
jgi:hypothetical protein